MDPTYWTDPEVFKPERHLNSEGQLIRTDHLIGFGAGYYFKLIFGIEYDIIWFSNYR